jgi:cytochrome P450
LQRPDLRAPRSTGFRDLLRLGLALGWEGLRHPFAFSAETVFRDWARRAALARNTQDLLVNLVVKKLFLVGSAASSREILAQPPTRDLFCTGSLKRSGMGFLAADALTISDDEDWVHRRAFNVSVLQPARRHEFAPQFVSCTLLAFDPPVSGAADVRAAMGRAMLGVVFGGVASAELVPRIESLFDLAQHPLKRLLTAPFAYIKRARLYGALRELWVGRTAAQAPSLLEMARRSADGFGGTELLEQIPHWMFTFTGSATDLIIRTLALITAFPDVRRRAMEELTAAGALDGPAFKTATLPFLEACLVETGHVYPPVTRTFHRAPAGAAVNGVQVPAGAEIVHLFPLFTDDLAGADAPKFNPDRWLQAPAPVCGFDPFLGGARACPGRSLILVICKTALASLLMRHRLTVQAPGIGESSLAPQFPSRGLKFVGA